MDTHAVISELDIIVLNNNNINWLLYHTPLMLFVTINTKIAELQNLVAILPLKTQDHVYPVV